MLFPLAVLALVQCLLIQLPLPHDVEFDGCRAGIPWIREECLGMDVVAFWISQLLCIMREMADHMPRIWTVLADSATVVLFLAPRRSCSVGGLESNND